MRYIIAFLVLVSSVLVSSTSYAQRGPQRPTPVQTINRIDAQYVEDMIARGKGFLYSQQKADGSWCSDLYKTFVNYPTGATAMACYALLSCDESVRNPKLKKALGWLATHPTNAVYTLGIRCCLWKLAAQQDKTYLAALRKDSNLLYRGAVRGGYYYMAPWNTKRKQGENFAHNSTAQYGVLGVWAGEAAGALETSKVYWKNVEKWWVDGQKRDGGWGYKQTDNDSRPSMTTAGIASLFLCFDHLKRDQFVKCLHGNLPTAIQKGLDYMARHGEESILKPGQTYHGHYTYHLYGCERVGLAAGYKYFGKCDWYMAGCRVLAGLMNSAGKVAEPFDHVATKDGVIPTSFALVFLRRGLYPVLFNKLQFQGDWNNRPRDIANLTEWFSKKFENEVRWQVTNLNISAADLHDSQFLYISGAKAPKFSDKEIDIIRTYSQQGGTIISVTECQGEGFQGDIRKVYNRIFPDYKLELCRPDHPIYTSYKKLNGRPRLHILTNGVRPLVIHTDEDLAKSWQLKASLTRITDFDYISNMVRYVVGRYSDLSSRFAFQWPEKATATSRTIDLLRIRHQGNWNPEPLAWKRFANMLSQSDKIDLKVSEVDITSLSSSQGKIAAITGTGELKLNSSEMRALKTWIDNGGSLIIDAANSCKLFYSSARKLLESSLDGRFKAVEDSDEMVQPGKIADKYRYRVVSIKAGCVNGSPSLEILSVNGRKAVILSRHDITSGLVGYPSGAAAGYECKSSQQLMTNIVRSLQ